MPAKNEAMRNNILIFLFTTWVFTACQKDSGGGTVPPPPPPAETMYFPPVGSSEWQTKTPASLGWNETELNNVYTYLQQKGTKAFIILKRRQDRSRTLLWNFYSRQHLVLGFCRKNHDGNAGWHSTKGRVIKYQ